MKAVKNDNKEKKEIKDKRRNDAMVKVRRDIADHTSRGMQQYNEILSDIRTREKQIKDRERAKSAQIYNTMRYQAELSNTGFFN